MKLPNCDFSVYSFQPDKRALKAIPIVPRSWIALRIIYSLFICHCIPVFLAIEVSELCNSFEAPSLDVRNDHILFLMLGSVDLLDIACGVLVVVIVLKKYSEFNNISYVTIMISPQQEPWLPHPGDRAPGSSRATRDSSSRGGGRGGGSRWPAPAPAWPPAGRGGAGSPTPPACRRRHRWPGPWTSAATRLHPARSYGWERTAVALS